MRTVLRIVLCLAMTAGIVGVPALSASAAGPDVGYYDTQAGAGVAAQVPPINEAGGNPSTITDPTTAQLAGIDVLFAQNPSNGGIAEEWFIRLPDITTAVANGLVLIFHDRWVNDVEGGGIGAADSAADAIPGAGSISFFRNFDHDRDIDVLNGSTTVTDGPGGVVGNCTLDNGNSSSHGYIDAATLPPGAVNPLARGDSACSDQAGGATRLGGAAHLRAAAPGTGSATGGTMPTTGALAVRPGEIVTTCFPLGRGAVIYSTIPLDFYLAGSGSPGVRDNMRHIYAPNVVAYGMEGACGGTSGPNGRVTNLFLHRNGAGPDRHSARVLVENNGPVAGMGQVILTLLLPGGGVGSMTGRTVSLLPRTATGVWFVFFRPPAPWPGLQNYIVRACILLVGDTAPADNCMWQTFPM